MAIELDFINDEFLKIKEKLNYEGKKYFRII